MDEKEKNKFRERINDRRQKRNKGWKRYFVSGNRHCEETRERFSWMKRSLVGPRVLDVGCGPGVMCHLALEKADVTEVHGLDLQDDALVEAQLNVKNDKACFHCGFAEALPFGDGYFDTVVMGEILEHVYDEKEAVEEAFRVLKSGGIVIVTVPNDGKLSFGHIRAFDKNDLTRLLTPYFSVGKIVSVGKHFVCIGRKK